MLIEIFCKYVLVLFIICNNQSFCKKLETYVKEYIPFPERIKELELVPNQFSWSMQNEFIFIDNFRDEIFLLKNNGEINLPTGAKRGNEVNSEIYDKNFYSIQLYYGNLDTANKLAKDFSKDFSEWETQIIFETPNYKLRVGKFKKILEAQKELEKIKKIYTSAFILMPNNL